MVEPRLNLFVSLPHGSWKNTKFLMKRLNGFPEGELHTRLDAGCVWEGRGRQTVNGRQKEEDTHPPVWKQTGCESARGHATAVLKDKLRDGNFIPPRMGEDLVKQHGGF